MKVERLRRAVVAVLAWLLVSGSTWAGWSEGAPVNEVNTEFTDKHPFLSFDGLTLYFCRIDTDTFYYTRIFEATRSVASGPFTAVSEISELNYSGGHVVAPWVSSDNLRMYYYRTEPPSVWRLKLSQRGSDSGPWPAGANISELNALGNVFDPTLTEDELTIVFALLISDQGDLYIADRPDTNSPFSNIRSLAEINTTSTETKPYITPDGLALYFHSGRNGLGQIFKATRSSREDAFGNLEHLSAFDTALGSSSPAISSDGSEFYLTVKDPVLETGDIYVSYWEAGKAWKPDPSNGAVYVDPATVLGWEAGEGAVSHDVYLGTNFNDVNDADTLSAEFMDNLDVNTFDPCGLELVTTYYWRIDEVNGPNVVKGDVWSFKTWAEPNLMAWWKFDEGEGSIAYDSAGNSDGSLLGDPVRIAGGIASNALYFDGDGDCVFVPRSQSLEPDEITVAMWALLDGEQSTSVRLLRKAGAYDTGYLLAADQTDDRTMQFRVGYPEVVVAADTRTHHEYIGAWHYFVGVYSKEHIALYIDGLEVSSSSHTSGSMAHTHDLYIGCGLPAASGEYFNGAIDEVRIYDRALSAGEILQLYGAGLGGRAFGPQPADGAVYVNPETVLGWEPGEGAVSHDVYLGTNYNDVNDADTLSAEYMDNVDVNSFDPCWLELATTYYWRIDEVNGPNTVKGDVWGFKTWAEPNLVAWWKFDEGGGITAYDSAGNHDGTLANGPTWTPSGINGALIFDGVDDYVEVPENDNLDFASEANFSVCVWIKSTLSSEPMNIIQKFSTVERAGYALRLNTFSVVGQISFQTHNYNDVGEISASHAGGFNDGNWHHLAGVRNQATEKIYLYVDAYEVDSTEEQDRSLANSADLLVGLDYRMDRGFFDGTIDEVRIYDRALSAEEIAGIYESATPVNYYYVDGVYGDDWNDGRTPETAFATIQKGIDEANDGDTVLVYPDVYVEELDFDGKAITVAGFDEPAVLRAPSFYAVSFFHGEDAN
ncbi:MAG: LamG-like jellyroll fold domain-containing protein, partial [Planctomycetota bacterium]